MMPKQRPSRKELKLKEDAKKLSVREELFSEWIDFDELEYVTSALYKQVDWSADKISKSVVNEYAATRINLTNLSWGLVMDLFVFHQVYQLMKPHGEGCVLDVGCGEPVLFDFMSDSFTIVNYVGIDLRANALKQFNNSKNCIVIADDIITTNAIRKGSMKVVVLSEVLEHLKRKDGVQLLKNIREWMSKDGRLVLTVPIKPAGIDIDMDHELKKWGHVHYYEIEELEELLHKQGYEIEHFTFGKFRNEIRIKHVRAAFIDKFGDIGEEIIDTLLSKLPQSFIAALFVNWVGDEAGHVQIVAKKRLTKKRSPKR